jgi:streptomycin 6-kinase
MSLVLPEPLLGFASRGESWRTWLDALPRLADEMLADWDLVVDGAPMNGECALVVPVRTPGAEPAVLKIGWPHWEAEHEHLALRAWAGDGAVRLLRADPHRWALLLERARADRDLTTVPVIEACELVAGLYQRLHRPALPQLRLLSEQAQRWSRALGGLRHDLVPRRYVEQAAALARDLASDASTDGTLIHTDLHYFNVLAADREPWLAIDPKPLSGDPAFEVAPLLWNRWDEAVGDGNIRQAIRRRFFTVVDAAGLDENRARDWVIVREMVNAVWAIEDAGPDGLPDVDWITTCVSITKAVQA